MEEQTKKQIVIVELFPSKQTPGDLIAFLPTGPNSSKVIVIDKNNDQFPQAAVNEVWEVIAADKGNWALGSLVRPVKLQFKRLLDTHGQCQLLVQHEGDNKPLVILAFPETCEWNQFTKGAVQIACANAGLKSLTSQIISEYRMELEWYAAKMEEAKEVVAEATQLLRAASTEGIDLDTIEVQDDMKMLDEIWSYIKLDEMVTGEIIAEDLVAEGYRYQKGHFVKAQADKVIHA